jgi:hypothetical protein
MCVKGSGRFLLAFTRCHAISYSTCNGFRQDARSALILPARANDYTDHEFDDREAAALGLQRMKRKAWPRRSKYLKKESPARRGIHQRRNRKVLL